MASAIAQPVASCSELCSILGLLNRVFVCGSILQRPRCWTLHLNWNVLPAYGLQTGDAAAGITRPPSLHVPSRLRQKALIRIQLLW